MPAIFGPAATAWFGFLQRYVVTNSKAGTIVARVAVDQTFFAPTQLTCFLSSMAIMEGTDPIEKLRTTFFQCYKANVSVWPFVQTVNFTFVPLEYRVLMVNMVSLGEYSFFSLMLYIVLYPDIVTGWNCLLSIINSGEM